MNNFAYRVRGLAGEETIGYRRGNSQEEVHAWLYNQGLIPVEVIPVVSSSRVKDRSLGYKEPKYSELSAFCWQLATMLDGGVLITTAIETISEDIDWWRSDTDSMRLFDTSRRRISSAEV